MNEPEVRALIERLAQHCRCGACTSCQTERLEAASALESLRAENARLNQAADMIAEERDAFLKSQNYWMASAADEKQRAERAEAEVARLKEQASAVVVIMPPREPTQEMDDAASKVDRSNLPGVFRRQVWRAMWDASGVAKASVITGNEP